MSGRFFRSIVALAALVALLPWIVGCGEASGRPFSVTAGEGGSTEAAPWEVWRDLRSLAVLHDGSRLGLRTSHCLSGCRFDRHSDGDERFIRMDGEEGVIFEESGPGAIVRIWMTTGERGRSVPIDPATWIRFYFDGETVPRLEMPLSDLFSGERPPFVPPLAGDRLDSSGGNFSYVPLPFDDGCRITLAGDLTQRLWYQIDHQRLSPDAAVRTFDGSEDLSALESLLATPGADPWPAAPAAVLEEGEVPLLPAEPMLVWHRDGGGTLTELALTLEPSLWPSVRLALRFDGQTTVEMSVADFFAARSGADLRSLWLSAQGSDLRSFFPMPFRDEASLTLTLEGQPGPVAVGYRMRLDPAEPLPGSGLFTARLYSASPSTAGLDVPLLIEDEPGKLVGLTGEIGSSGPTVSRVYLEGDERIFLDGRSHPNHYGTGVEDFFNGGFYFDQGPFETALHGMLAQGSTPEGEDSTFVYRFLLTDALPWGRSITAGLEGGESSNLAIRTRTVAYYYLDPDPGLVLADTLIPADAASRSAHGYQVSGSEELRSLAGGFEGEPAEMKQGIGVYRSAGEATFELDASICRGEALLRWLRDASLPGQELALTIDGQPAGGSAFTLENPYRPWAEKDLLLPPVHGGDLAVAVTARPQNPEGLHSEFRYELWCRPAEDTIFADFLESGSTGGWSRTVP